ncbi:uncharacterized protein DNG_03930 [Cephalotrichum gorgonifer]|uniref:Uncharacterized protein n=1 Tax=Cephalotrichum gorgonifer TaxID=2041049 RepID=A0AAE8SU24_9PEZI|nr:uncharacterized protein DNG_03930 [Cephalotrichum gorgonifer]
MATRIPQPERTPPRYRVRPNYARWSEPLPYPAVALVIAQHLFLSHCGRYWAWLIVGTFYDRNDEALWRAEVFMAMNPGEEDDGRSSAGDVEGDELSEAGESEEHEEESGYEFETLVSDSNSDSGGASSWLGDDSADDGEESGHDSQGESHDIPRSQALAQLYRNSGARISHIRAQRPPPPPDTHPHFRQPYRHLAPGIYSPPPQWDPTRQGAVPGHWNAAYDNTLGWVSYFQPRIEN